MAKYTFTKPFSKKIAVGGVVGLGMYSKNIGDVVEGDIINDKQTGEQQLKVLINKSPIQGADMFVYIPLSFLSAGSSATSSQFPTVAVFGVAAVFLVILAVVFWKK